MAQVDSFAAVGVEGQVCVPPPLLMVRVYCTLVVKLSCCITTVAVVAPVPTALKMTGALQKQWFERVGNTCLCVLEQKLQGACPVPGGVPQLQHAMQAAPGTWERW